MDNTLRLQRINALLAPGETVLWSDRPAQGVRFRRVDFVLIPFSLVWCSIVLFASINVSRGPTPPWPAQSFMLLFVAVGFYILVGRFIGDAYQRSHTTYTVTDRAAYILTDGILPKTLTYSGAALVPIDLRTGSGGTGTISFGPQGFMTWSSYNRGSWSPILSQVTGIPNAARVYGLLRNLTDR